MIVRLVDNLLDCDGKDGMRPRRGRVHRGAADAAADCPTLQTLQHGLTRRDHLFVGANHLRKRQSSRQSCSTPEKDST